MRTTARWTRRRISCAMPRGTCGRAISPSRRAIRDAPTGSTPSPSSPSSATSPCRATSSTTRNCAALLTAVFRDRRRAGADRQGACCSTSRTPLKDSKGRFYALVDPAIISAHAAAERGSARKVDADPRLARAIRRSLGQHPGGARPLSRHARPLCLHRGRPGLPLAPVRFRKNAGTSRRRGDEARRGAAARIHRRQFPGPAPDPRSHGCRSTRSSRS